ncbi:MULTISPECIES: terpene synthase family protein [unclassified Streptomyces]|uniref:terpene synthase family protein n=1 Tax=unclassified Streptomyces TaxID=2593676 RepID=UPI0022574308|nr:MULTISPECIES: hypothetical protein [unclassified Streptomyces]MCX4633080.1 terpene synthase family protein [Streptomyces sp. NBC_01443]
MTHVIDDGATYELCAIPRLLAQHRHPNIERLEPRHDRWLTEHYPFATDHARDAFLAQRSALWTALTYPVTDEDRFYDLARLTSFLFAFDDLFLQAGPKSHTDAKQVLEDTLQVMQGGPPATAHGSALAQIWQTMAQRMPARQRHRLVEATQDFATGCFREVSSRQRGSVLDLANYTSVRVEQSLAAWVYFILTEYAAGVDLPDPVLARLRPLHWACAEHLLFSNDLFSFRAEHFCGDHVNAVCVLLETGATLQQAIDKIVGLVTLKEKQVADMLTALRHSRLGAESGPESAYLRHLEYVISGNLEQSRFAARYHGSAELVHRPIHSGTVTLFTDRTDHRRSPSTLDPPGISMPPSGRA